MNEPLDDFNRRMTAGSASWMQGSPTNATESAAQSFIDAQPRAAIPGGGSIDFGARVCGILLFTGILLFGGGAYVVDNMGGGVALLGILILIVSGFLMLIGGGGLVVDGVRSLGTSSGRRRLLFAALAAFLAWWFSTWLWMMSFGFVPKGLIPFAAASLVFIFMGSRR